MFFGLLTLAMASLLFELAVVKLFSVIIFSNYAFMIISTALFGMGLSGVICSLKPSIKEKYANPKGFSLTALLFSVTSVLAFLVINNLPLQLAKIYEPAQMLNLAIYYLVLMTPFFFSGLTIVLIFSRFSEKISRLYFYDLVGAAFGCILMIPMFKTFGGSGSFFIIAAMGLFSALLLNEGKNKFLSYFILFLLVLTALFLPRLERIPVKVHDFKRTYKNDQINNNIEFSKWSTLSKIDIAIAPEAGWKRLWIDGGTNESALIEFDGNFHSFRPNLLNTLLIAVPYQIKKSPAVAIIGSSGGREVLMALNNDPESIDAIEMDPTICHVVKGPYSEYLGNIFHDKRVNLVCDEGRSFIKRSNKKYDIIHQINNFTPVAMASGAINVSESYLLTTNALDDYWGHLKDDGYLVFNRHNTFKIAILADYFLSKKNLDAKDHIIVIEGEDKLNNGFYLKKSPFTKEEISSFKEEAAKRSLQLIYSPDMDKDSSWYYRLLIEKDRESFKNLKGFSLKPPTDNCPFFEHIEGLGQADISDPDLPKGLHWIHRVKKFGNRISVADLTFLVILTEATLFSAFFIFIPLFISKSKAKSSLDLKFLAYFGAIGFSYIVVELCLIQKFVLFLGVPSISISTVIFALLFASGAGSLMTENIAFADIFKALKKRLLILAVFLLLFALFLSSTLNLFLGLAFYLRVIISLALIFPLGFVMGMFFPLGIRLASHFKPEIIPWCWGINSYATVIGSVMGVVIAIYSGFTAVFITALIIYVAGIFIAVSSLDKASEA